MKNPVPSARGELPVETGFAWRLDGAARDPASPLVLALHGMGMEEDFLARLLESLFDLPLRFLIPRAPFPVMTPAEGRLGASWYAYDGDQERFRAELLRTERSLLGLLAHVERTRGLAPRARYLFGFSQGGYAGGFCALRHPEIFRGLIVSGSRVKHEFLREEIAEAGRRGFAALILHGRRDASVTPRAAETSHQALAAGGVRAELRLFDAGHTLGRKQVAAMREWLERETARADPPGD